MFVPGWRATRELLHWQLRPSTRVEQQHRSRRENSWEEACREINSFAPFPISLQISAEWEEKTPLISLPLL